MQKTKSGKEIVDEFVDALKFDASLNQDVVKAFSALHAKGKLSDKNIANALEALRKKRLDEDTTDISSEF